MANKILCIVKNNYVINRVVIDDSDNNYTYPFPHDLVVEDVDAVFGVGDWYESSEQIFYRPVNATPPDLPSEIIRPQ